MKMDKVLWVKFGWSDYYRGGPVDGDFGYLQAKNAHEVGNRGHEAFNFAPDLNGTYFCHVPPQAGYGTPANPSSEGWTVICLAKHPKRTGIHIVGWYENAKLLGRWEESPVAAAAGEDGLTYNVTSSSAFLIPPEQRTRPFSHSSVRQAKYSFLRAPGEKPDKNKREVLRILQDRIEGLRGVAVHNPNALNAPDPEDEIGVGFGTPAHRRAVEKAAEAAVVAHYEKQRFSYERVADEKRGYDFVFTKKDAVLHVEVKGTAASEPRFFLTRREYGRSSDPLWRLAMVTNALSARPTVEVMTGDEMAKEFAFEPLAFACSPKPGRKTS